MSADDITMRFLGTDNPRHIRAINALMQKPRAREELDKICGCSNGPELVAGLRRLGLDVPCERIKVVDRDGKLTRPGVYTFDGSDREKVLQWRRSKNAS